MNPSGATAIVTGAGGGIGAAIARRLVDAGARVLLTDLDADRVREVAAGIEASHPGSALALAGDVSRTEEIQRSIDTARYAFGPVDLYVANAGVGGGVGLEADDADWTNALEVNVLAHVRAARLLVPDWVDRGRGYFVATASAAGLLTQIGSPTYSVSKHGAVAFAEWLSVTYGNRGIGVSCLCPMGVNTAMLHPDPTSDPITQQAAQAVTGAGSVLEPEQVADDVLSAIQDERFLILPHPEVIEFWRRKTSDYDRWLAGMRRYQDSLTTPEHETRN